MISVCMATYNGEKYLEGQIESIVSQLHEDDELIVSDDGSTDATLRILESFQQRYPIVKIVEGPHLGIIANFENAISNASGDYIFLSDQDDVWSPRKVERVMAAFRSVESDLVVHNAEIVDSDLRPLGLTAFEWRASGPGLIKNLKRNSFIGCCMAFRRELLPLCLPFPRDIAMHDWWLGLVSSLNGNPMFVDDCLIKYRRHGGNASKMTHKGAIEMLSDRLQMVRSLLLRMKEIRNL